MAKERESNKEREDKLDSASKKLDSTVEEFRGFVNEFGKINKDVAAKNGPKLVTGSSTLLVKYDETVATQRYYWYNPRAAAVGRQDDAGKWEKDAPVTVLDNTGVWANEGQETFYEKASQRGTIFIYEQNTEGKINSLIDF